MTFSEGMTDAALDAEIERLAREVASCEVSYDAEYQTENDKVRVFNQAVIKEVMEEAMASWERAQSERRRRMGFWIIS